MENIEVVAAIIIYGEKILCVQRAESKYDYISFKYEFPGGKIEPGETRENAIKREIDEELKMDIEIVADFLSVIHEYRDFKLTMHSFICRCDKPELKMQVHIDYKWLNRNELSLLDWAAADLPIVQKLMCK